MRRLTRVFLIGSIGAVCAACGPPNPSPSATGVAGLRQEAKAYAQAILDGRFSGVEGALSAECKSSDHITPENLPLARASWERQLGISFDSTRITGVKVRDITPTSAQAEVEYNQSAGNDNWVSYVFQNGRWAVGGQCAVPIGDFESSSSSG